MYIANLLGVAGTDIPIKEIQKLLSPFKVLSSLITFYINRVS